MHRSLKPQTDFTLTERLQSIAAHLPAMQAGGDDRQIEELLSDFVQTTYRYGWIQGEVNWPKWKQTPEAEQLRDNPAVLAQATVWQLTCLLTTCIRQERFCEGSLNAAYRAGLLTGIVERAVSLSEEVG